MIAKTTVDDSGLVFGDAATAMGVIDGPTLDDGGLCCQGL